MNIQIQGEYSEKILRKSVSLSSRPSKIKLTILAVIGVFFMIGIQATLSDPELTVTQKLNTILPILIVPLIFGYLFYFFPRKHAAQLFKLPFLQGHIIGAITEETIYFATQSSSSTLKWGDFTSYRMADDVVVLYLPANTGTIIPKSFFADEVDWQTFTEFVHRTLPDKSSQRSAFSRYMIWIYVFVLFLTALISFLLSYFG